MLSVVPRWAGFWLMMLTIVIAPWLLGGNRVIFLLGLVIVLLWASIFFSFSLCTSSKHQSHYYGSWLILLAVAVWCSPPLSEFKRGLIASQGLGVGHDVHLEWLVFFQIAGCVAVAYSVPLALSSYRRLELACLIIIGNATFQVLYGAYILSGGERFLYWPEGDLNAGEGTGVMTANFPNRNHFAGHLEMASFLILGLLISYYLKGKSRVQKNTGRAAQAIRRAVEYLLGREGRLRAVIVILMIGLVLTQSRSGNIAYGATLCFCAVFLYKYLPEARRVIAVLFLSILFIDILIISNFVGLEQVVDRVVSTDLESEGRVDLNRLSLKMLADYWLTGIGAGNYGSFVRGYQGIADEEYFLYAHNDVMEFAIELGVPVFLLLVVYVLWSVFAGLQAFVKRQNPYFRGVGLGAACAVISLSIHAFTDFNHQIPANSFLFVFCTSLCWVCKLSKASP